MLFVHKNGKLNLCRHNIVEIPAAEVAAAISEEQSLHFSKVWTRIEKPTSKLYVPMFF